MIAAKPLRTSAFLPIFLFICALFSSCNGPRTSDNQSADSTRQDTVAQIDEQELVNDEPVEEGGPIEEYEPQEIKQWDDTVRKYFPANHEQVNAALQEFNEIQTASDLAQFYMVTLPFVEDLVNKRIQETFPDLGAGDDSPSGTWGWFAEYFPCIGFDILCGECSYEAMGMHGLLVAKAEQTPEKEDDLFFSLTKIYDTYDGRGRSIGNTGGWYTLTDCDFCLSSLVGSGQRYEILQKLEAAAPARKYFGQVMDQYKVNALDVAEEHYYYDKQKVLKELDQMLTCKILSADEKDQIKEVRNSITTNQTSSQFNCGGERCDFGDLMN